MTLTPEREAEWDLLDKLCRDSLEMPLAVVIEHPESGDIAHTFAALYDAIERDWAEIDRLRQSSKEMYDSLAPQLNSNIAGRKRAEQAIRGAEQLLHDGQSARAWGLLQEFLAGLGE